MYICPHCSTSFTRSDNMKTHVRKYDELILDVERKANNGNSTNMRLLEHPFRMVVAAPFIAGKTTFVYKLLKNSKHVNFQRITWCYNQYQPLYDTLKDEVQNIEFVRGIPDDISEEYFLTPKDYKSDSIRPSDVRGEKRH